MYLLSSFLFPCPNRIKILRYKFILYKKNQYKYSESLFLCQQLIAGLYTFKIEVTGVNRVGEAYVNVTVLPRKSTYRYVNGDMTKNSF